MDPTDPFAAPPRPSTNALGIAGFVTSLVGLLACPLIAPIGLILSFIAIFREPRGFAIAGLVIGIVGSILMLIIALVFGALLFIVGAAISAHGLPGLEATIEMIDIGQKTIDYRRDRGNYPASLDSLTGLSTDGLTDSWGRAYEYTLSSDGSTFTLKSLGADGKPDTADDIVLDQAWLSNR